MCHFCTKEITEKVAMDNARRVQQNLRKTSLQGKNNDKIIYNTCMKLPEKPLSKAMFPTVTGSNCYP